MSGVIFDDGDLPDWQSFPDVTESQNVPVIGMGDLDPSILPDDLRYQYAKEQSQQVPSKGLGFDWSALNVQTEEDIERLSPAQKEILRLWSQGVRFNDHEAAQFVLNFENPRNKAQTAKAKKEVERFGIGQIPAGFRVIDDEETGTVRLGIIPGGPAERQAKETAEFTALMAQTVVDDVNRAIEIIDRSPGKSTAWGHMLLKNKPGSDALALVGRVDSIMANLSLDNLVRLKQTGAGLGQVPQSQLEMLGQALGNLNLLQQPDDIKYDLQRISEIYKAIISKATGDDLAILNLIKADPDSAERLLDQFEKINSQRQRGQSVTQQNSGSASVQAPQHAAQKPVQGLPRERVVGGRRFVLNERGNYVPAD